MEVINQLLESLGVNSSFFACCAIFLITYFLARFIAFGSVSQYLVERDNRIAGREIEIKKIEEDLENIHLQLSEERKIAQKDAAEVFNELKKSAVEENRKIVNDAKLSASDKMKSLRATMESQVNVEKEKLKKEVDPLSDLFLSNLMKKSTNLKKKHESLRTGV